MKQLLLKKVEMSDYKTLVVPFDFSAHSRAALVAATDLAKRLGADLHLVHVVHLPTYAYGYAAYGSGGGPPAFDLREVLAGAQHSLNEVVEGVEGIPGKIEAHVVEGSGIAEALRDSATKVRADLIVMGTHGRTGLAHVFLGSVAERTLRTAPCPVLTVRASEEEEAEDRETS